MSKKITYVVVAALLIALVYILVFQSGQGERAVSDVLIENDTYSLSFNYFDGVDGYELINSATSDNFLQSYVLIEKEKLVDYQVSDAETAPPTISIFIFQLPEAEEVEGEKPGRITRLQNWAQNNSGLTSFERIYGTPKIVEIDGVKSLEYSTDGTYQQSVFLSSYRGYVYMFVGQHDRPTDDIKADFETLMKTVHFE